MNHLHYVHLASTHCSMQIGLGWDLIKFKQLNCVTPSPWFVTQNCLKVNILVSDMCVVDQKLVTVSGRWVDVFDIGSKTQTCRISDVLPNMRHQIDACSVTGTELGYLFVCDTNN